MRQHYLQLNLSLRVLAAMTLVLWLAEMTFCAWGETVSVGSESSAVACAVADSCGGHCDTESPSSPSKPVCPPDSSACQAVKSALLGGSEAKLNPPTPSVLYMLPLVALAFESQFDQPTASLFRHVRPRHWVFTPEVSLGPAFRSLAPPSFLS